MRIDRCDHSLDRTYRLSRIHLRPDEKWAISQACAGQRKIDLFGVAAVEFSAARIARNPNHLVCRSICNEFYPRMHCLVKHPQPEALPDRILAWPYLFCRGLTEDDTPFVPVLPLKTLAGK